MHDHIDPTTLRLATLEAVKKDAMEFGDTETIDAVNTELERRIQWAKEFNAAVHQLAAEEEYLSTQ